MQLLWMEHAIIMNMLIQSCVALGPIFLRNGEDGKLVEVFEKPKIKHKVMLYFQ